MLSRIKKRHIALFASLAALSLISIVYLQNDQDESVAIVRPYEQDRDFRPIVKLVNDNKFLMSENPDFSAEQMLLTRAPSYAPEKKGLATILVVEDEGATAGFVAFYKKGPEHGFIWLLGVDKIFRGRGYGERLMKAALKELKRHGATYVTIATRLINKPALSLYKKLGFTEQHREEDRGMVTLIKHNL